MFCESWLEMETTIRKECNSRKGEMPEVIIYLFIIFFSLLEMFIALNYRPIVVSDSPLYIETSKWFLGQFSLNGSIDMEAVNEAVFQKWNGVGFLRPTVILLAAGVSLFTGIITAYVIVNACFWLGSVLILYKYSFFLLQKRKLAIYTCLFFSSSLPVLLIGLAVLTDMGGFFFLILTFYLIVNPPKKTWQTFLSGIIFGIALLTRQSLALSFMFLFIYEFTTGRNWKRLITIICPAVFLFAFYTLFMYLRFGIDFSSMLVYSTTFSDLSTGYYFYGDRWGLVPFIVSFINAFFPAIILGIIGGYTKYRQKELRPYDLILILIIPSIIITPYMRFRFTFLLFPAVLPLATIGLQVLSRKITSHYSIKFIESNIWELVFLFLCILLPNLWIIFKGRPYLSIQKKSYRNKYIPII